ncbi:C2H2 type zinc-finger-domain-containing protein [Jimgerdemannia flammicorona]|uniref:C2H2 type zinc-finger-domain-containing protein n=1 Tax=Jimgerdemannia flammicorona TaxID=994334 RepID=A0A433Q8K4_9FUNG|nr:C2H2 type zinc-finger-domain-containing protein [Jimgerdemannia flammicorona]
MVTSISNHSNQLSPKYSTTPVMDSITRTHVQIPFTCSTCRVRFLTATAHRDHHRSPWHNHNLQRKLVQAEPVDEARFAARMTAAQSQAEDLASGQKCLACNRTCVSERQYLQHLRSKKHLDRETYLKSKKSAPETVGDDDATKETSQSDPVLVINGCLFCGYASSDIDSNVHHMIVKHSFFIPDAEYLSDKEGLLKYLSHKLTIDHACLWCFSTHLHEQSENDKGLFRNLRDVRKHMLDKGHCKILYEGGAEREIEGFYDFTGEVDMKIDAVKRVERKKTLAELTGNAYVGERMDADGGHVVDDDDDEWDDIDADDDTLTVASLDVGSTVFTATSSDPTTMDLILPSGYRLGHRQNQRYYRQNLHRSSALQPVSNLTSSSALVGSLRSFNNVQSADVAGNLPSQRNNQALLRLPPQIRAVVARQETRAQHVATKKKKGYQLQQAQKDNMNMRQKRMELHAWGGFNH